MTKRDDFNGPVKLAMALRAGCRIALSNFAPKSDTRADELSWLPELDAA
jgi:hypothetical protein